MSITRAIRRFLLVVSIAAVAVCRAGAVGFLMREPTLEGRSVRDLVREAADYSHGPGTNRGAAEVFRRSGSKAVPGLVRIMAPVRPSLARRAARELTTRYWLRCRLPKPVLNWAERTVLDADRRISDREWAVVWCASLGADAKAAHPALIAACSDADWHVRKEAAKALVRTDVEPTVAVRILSQMVLGDREVRKYAADSLSLLHEKAEAAIPALRQAANDPNEWVASSAREALRKIEDASAPKKVSEDAIKFSL
jgi:HEAT repeat protein